MCGIIGAYLPENNLQKETFAALVDTLRHRGPDERGVFTENDFYIGMRRLSIIDLTTGSQPIFNEDSSKLVLFNGEIYNYKELMTPLIARGHHFKTQSDTEVIVHSLEEGIDHVRSFRGMFAISYFDRSARMLTLIRDRVGVKPLYYYHEKGRCFLYASELKGLKALATQIGVQFQVSDDAVYHYLSFANVPQPQTIYKNVFALPPGYILQFQNDQLSLSKYWDYEYQPKFSGNLQEAMDRCEEIIKESVRLRLRSDVPLGIFLSGGLDSSAVAYEAARLTSHNLKTFTVGMEDSPELDESAIARETAQRLGIENTMLPLKIDPLQMLFKVSDVYDQPFGDPSAIPSLEISRMAQSHVKVVLNGDGGDEQLAGYRRYGLAKQLSLIPDLSWVSPIVRRMAGNRRSWIGFLDRIARISGLHATDQYIALTTDLLLDAEKQTHWLKQKPSLSTREWIADQQLIDGSTLDRVMHWDRRFNLLSGLLVKMDMATSAYSLEGRSPFLDHTLFEFTSVLPGTFKYNGNISKYLLRKLYSGKLSQAVTTGAKKGFEIPLIKWLQYDFRDIIHQIIAKKDLKIYSFLSPDFVRDSLLLKIHSEKNQGYLAYSIINLAIWLDRDKF